MIDEIKLESKIYQVVGFTRKTTAAFFKNLVAGDILQFSKVIYSYRYLRGTTEIECLSTGEKWCNADNQFLKNITALELRELNK